MRVTSCIQPLVGLLDLSGITVGKDAATLDHFFDDLGADRAQAIQAVSMDMSPAFRKSVSTHAGQAVICYDPFYGDLGIMPML